MTTNQGLSQGNLNELFENFPEAAEVMNCTNEKFRCNVYADFATIVHANAVRVITFGDDRSQQFGLTLRALLSPRLPANQPVEILVEETTHRSVLITRDLATKDVAVSFKTDGVENSPSRIYEDDYERGINAPKMSAEDIYNFLMQGDYPI